MQRSLLGTARIFGNNKEPFKNDGTEPYGWVFYATVPDTVDIPDNFTECFLPGGLYASVESGDDVTEAWEKLMQFITESNIYEYDANRPCLEEFIPGEVDIYYITLYAAIKNNRI